MATNPPGIPQFIGLPTPGPLSNYLSQICGNFRGSTKFLAWLAANLTPYQDGIACLNTFDQAFGLLTAVGPQLDVLGAILGQPRTVGFQPRFGVSPVLDDTTYRLLLQATIYRNHWSGKLIDLWPGWFAIFPSSKLLISDHEDMTVSLLVGLSASTIVEDLITNGYIIPRPQGVLYNITIQSVGWNTESWGSAPWGR